METRERKARTRKKTARCMVVPKGMSLLEVRAVSPKVLNDYANRHQDFKDFCSESGHSTDSAEDIDNALAEWFDLLYLKGYASAEGSKTLCAMMHFDHRLRKEGPFKLTRAPRALVGWRRAAPGSSRLPLPLALAEGMVMAMLSKQLRTAALYVATLFALYLRPSEGLALKGRDIVEPVAVAGDQHVHLLVIVRNSEDKIPDKVGEYDNSLKVDQNFFKFLAKALLDRSRAVGKAGLLFPMTFAEANRHLKEAARRLRVDDGVCLYQCRHGGAAHDLNAKARTRDEVMARGRWRTDQTVRRYTKIGKVQALLGRMPKESLEFCRASRVMLDTVVAGRRLPLPPPFA